MRSPVRGGLKGGRRSVKRGQSVEFADYRDYAPGDDLRQLDWNVYARLEKLFVKLFVEEEDVTDHAPHRRLGVDGDRPRPPSSCSRSARRRRSATSGSRARTASRSAHWPAGSPGAGPRCAAPAASSGCWPTCRPSSRPTARPTSSRPLGTPAAQLHGRGVVVLISDLLDPAADRVIRELAATGSELIVLHVLSPDELDPPLEGDLRLVDVETGEGIDVTVDLATIDAYKARLAAWKAGFADLAAKRRASYVDLPSDANLADLMFAELRRRRGAGRSRRCRSRPRSRCSGCCSSRRSSRCTCSSCGATRRVVPSTLLWTRLLADVEANAPWQRLRRSLLLLLQLLLVVILALLAARPFLERPAGLARDVVLVDRHVGQHGRHGRRRPNRLEAAKAAALDALRDLPTGGKVSVIAADRERPDRRQRDDRPRAGPPGARRTSSRPARTGDLGDALELAGKLAARSGDAQILVATDGALATPPTVDGATPRSRSCRSGRDRKNQAIVALAVRTAPSAVTRSVFVEHRQPRPRDAPTRRLEVWGDGGLLEVRDLAARRRRRARTSSSTTCRATSRPSSSGWSAPDPAVTARARPAGASTTGPGRSSRPTGPA